MLDRFLRFMSSSDGAEKSGHNDTWSETYIMQGLYVITDIYPFHLQARKVDLISQIRRLLTCSLS